MKRSNTYQQVYSLLSLTLLLGLSILSPVRADITFGGDVNPSDPLDWDSSTDGYVGYNSNGSIVVNGGSDLYSNGGYFGYNASSWGEVSIDGAGSTWTMSDQFYVNTPSSSNSLSITNGGTLSTPLFVVENNSQLQLAVTNGTLDAGEIDIFSGGILNVTSDLSLGSSGAFTLLDLNTNGQFSLTGDLYVGYGAQGIFSHNNGTSSISGTLHIGGISNLPNFYRLMNGSLTATTMNVGTDGWGYLHWFGGTLDAETVNVGLDGIMQVQLDWTCEDAVNIHGGELLSFENLVVGDQDSGTLTISHEGLARADKDLTIDSGGAINLSDGGMLAIFGEADDSLGQFFDLVQGTDAIQWWDPAVSDWNSLTTATLGTDYTLEYQTGGDLDQYTLLTVNAIEPGPGDANRDGKVDGSDATILATYWQTGVNDSQAATWSMGDFNGDNKVDGSDATILATYWQTGVNNTNAVPEPSSVALLAMLLFTTGLMSTLRKCGPKS